jgi:pantoate--beta-alanine ligase
MKKIEKIEDIRRVLDEFNTRTIGFVPTMGYLHEGHLSLVRQSKRGNDITVVSLFVNPAQFGPHEDFDRYPRDLDRDMRLLEELNVDYLFAPDLQEIYPDGYATYVEVEGLANHLCGKSRPGHFRGVATVVLKLFHIVRPTNAYFGQKDAQQAVIIKKMVGDLNLDVNIRMMPIVRDADGLALSSRNAYLSAEERKAGLLLSRALNQARSLIDEGVGEVARIKREVSGELAAHPLVKVDYLEFVSLDRLEPIATVMPGNTLAAGAIYVGKTRLIDNFVLGEI